MGEPLLAPTLASLSLLSSCSPHLSALAFYLSVSSLTILLLLLVSFPTPLGSLFLSLLPSPQSHSVAGLVFIALAFSSPPPPSGALPKGSVRELSAASGDHPRGGSHQGRETKSTPASHWVGAVLRGGTGVNGPPINPSQGRTALAPRSRGVTPALSFSSQSLPFL